MGWSYRKSLNFGPFRLNVSKSGVGYSIGAGGVRTGVSATGRKYNSVSIPGTGLRHTSNEGKRTGCLALIVLLLSFNVLLGLILFS